ncbi:MAG: CRISPR-associated endonuclease Cas1 [Deltaproteobacteria bacterium]|nr:CRISPR-associated endonuclease Cas1 [Deltaproteobacteria bacterium]
MDHQPPDLPTTPSRLTWDQPLAKPELLTVPARMVNEVLYCERLMYLEWVQGEFADNFFTVDGRATHQNVDKPGGALADPQAPTPGDEPRVARSVWLTSERLGLTAKIDLVESSSIGTAVPIEFKRGKSPDVPERAFLPERAQVCAQALLLREHGYVVEHAEIYFAGDRRRSRIELTDELIDATLAAVARARQLAESGELPPVLVESPKCLGCSLAPLCLPDEVTLLKKLEGSPASDLSLEPEGAVAPSPEDPIIDEPEPSEAGPQRSPNPKLGRVRPLYPGRDDKLAVYVRQHGARISLEALRIKIVTDEEKTEARLPNTSQVSIFGNVSVTTPVIRALLEHDIPLCIFTYGGWYLGRTVAQGSNNAQLKLAQYAAATDERRSLSIAQQMIRGKILNQRTILRRNLPSKSPVVLNELRVLANKASQAESAEVLLGLEGTAARRYFRELPALVRVPIIADEFSQEGRNRRPPKDPLNSVLSFLYALLVKEAALALGAAGLEPMIGFFHKPRFGRPGLALDLMEEFRPIVADSTAVTVFNTGVLGPDDFVRGNGACALRAPARKRLIEAYERRIDASISHPIFEYRITYRRLLELQARLLSRHLLGELDCYPAFRTR